MLSRLSVSSSEPQSLFASPTNTDLDAASAANTSIEPLSPKSEKETSVAGRHR